MHYFSLTDLFKTEYPVVHTHDKRVEMSVPGDTFIEKAEAKVRHGIKKKDVCKL